MVGVLFLMIFLLISVLIVGLVLLQEGKGGGLAGMSPGMDGVMGAKNPLRKMTAWLFVFFVLMAITINWYFHQRTDTSIPVGIETPDSTARVLEENIPSTGPTVLAEPVAEGALRPETLPAEAPAIPLRPDSATGTESSGQPAETPAPETSAPEPAVQETPVPEPAGDKQPPPAEDSGASESTTPPGEE